MDIQKERGNDRSSTIGTRCIYLEFEGVYKNSTVSLNGIKVGGRPYGYVPFLVKLDDSVKYGEENVLTVEVDNSKLPNSRWYTVSGIYRPVSMSANI